MGILTKAHRDLWVQTMASSQLPDGRRFRKAIGEERVETCDGSLCLCAWGVARELFGSFMCPIELFSEVNASGHNISPIDRLNDETEGFDAVIAFVLSAPNSTWEHTEWGAPAPMPAGVGCTA